MQKTCNRCSLTKNLDQFGSEPKGYLKKKAVCLACHAEKRAESRGKKGKSAEDKCAPVIDGAESSGPETVIIETHIAPVDAASVEREVQRRVDEELARRKEEVTARQVRRTKEQRAQLRAVKTLIDNHHEEYERLLARELIRVGVYDGEMAS